MRTTSNIYHLTQNEQVEFDQQIVRIADVFLRMDSVVYALPLRRARWEVVGIHLSGAPLYTSVGDRGLFLAQYKGWLQENLQDDEYFEVLADKDGARSTSGAGALLNFRNIHALEFSGVQHGYKGGPPAVVVTILDASRRTGVTVTVDEAERLRQAFSAFARNR